MAKYQKKVQVLLTDRQFKNLEELASKRNKKQKQKVAEAVDRLLSLPPVPVPESWEEFEKELARAHGFHK